MIDTLFFALQIIGVVVLLGWAVLHDRLEEGAPTRGPLAFKQDARHGAGRGRGKREQAGLTRRRARATLDDRRP